MNSPDALTLKQRQRLEAAMTHDHNKEMDDTWKFRLERQRIQDAWEKAQWDRTERRVMTILYVMAFLLMLIIGAGVIVALRESKASSASEPGSLTIIVPASTPTPTPEAAEPTLFGTSPDALEARMLRATEPPTLRTVQNHPPSASPRKAGATTYDSTVRRSKPYPAPWPLPRRDSRSVGNAASQGLPMRLGVTGWRDSHYSQAFEDAAAWKDTRGLVWRLPALTRSPLAGAGIKPGRHLRTLAIRQAGRCKVPASLALTLVSRESSWNPLAVSSAGAVGLAQVRPYHSGPLLDVRDPETNLSLGFCLLRRHFDRLKGWNLDDARAWRMALEAYHGGQYRTRTAAITRRYATDIVRGSAQ